ncbi:MAG: hypothetical protein KC656_27470, partial [Myxococcales bacterium]|nr:hypothetical protein [Myxococcales bacterium]
MSLLLLTSGLLFTACAPSGVPIVSPYADPAIVGRLDGSELVHPERAAAPGEGTVPLRLDSHGSYTLDAGFAGRTHRLVFDPTAPVASLAAPALAQMGVAAGDQGHVVVDTFAVGPHSWRYATLAVSPPPDPDNAGVFGRPLLEGRVWRVDLDTEQLGPGDADLARIPFRDDLVVRGSIGGVEADVQLDIGERQTGVTLELATALHLLTPGGITGPGQHLVLPAIQLDGFELGAGAAVVIEGAGKRVVLGRYHLLGRLLTLDVDNGRLGLQDAAPDPLQPLALEVGARAMVGAGSVWRPCTYDGPSTVPRDAGRMVYKAHLAHRFVCGTDLATTLWVRSPDSVREPMSEDALKAVMDSLARPI